MLFTPHVRAFNVLVDWCVGYPIPVMLSFYSSISCLPFRPFHFFFFFRVLCTSNEWFLNSWYVTCFCVQDWLLHLTSSISPALPLTRGLLAGNCWLLLVRFFLIDHFLPLHYKDINVSILYLTAEVEELCGRKDQTSGNYQGYSSASEQVMSVLIHISPPVCLAYFRSKYFVSLILILSDLIWLCMYSWIQLILVGAAWISQLESKKFK